MSSKQVSSRGRRWKAATAATITAIAGLAVLPAGPAAAATNPLVSAASARCLDVKGNVDTAGTPLDIWDCNGQVNQAFEFTSAGELRTMNGTRCVDAFNNQTTAGAQVIIWTCNGQANQQWRLNANGSITGVQSGLCLDVDHAGTANGTSVILWTCNGQTNQNWTAQPTPTTLVVNAGSVVRPVTRVGNGTLYGLSDASTPSVSIMQPLKLRQLRQPPPNTQHRPNGSPVPIGDTLVIAANAKAIGAVITVDMADSFDGFPYIWTSWSDWYARIDKMIADVKARPDITNIDAWEIWNEPDWTWPSATGVSFNDGWVNSYRRIRQTEPSKGIMGPSDSYWDVNRMRAFLTNAKATNTLPQIISWHELSGWQQVDDNVAAYRALETELGISPLPISINEYATPSEIDVPSAANHYVAQFERSGVRDAERAFWYEAGTLNGLLYNSQPTASYWMYKWYADQTGNIVQVTPTATNDAVASYNSSTRSVSVVFGGQSGNGSIQVKGLAALGSTVTATLDYVPGSGRQTNIGSTTRLSSTSYTVTNGTITIPITGQNPSGAYNLTLTPQ
ncbi:RICIN domain-containing protein [Actinocorallia longicatena]|uniref:Ricin B lectin domain-containing protein n=1 Tax=Actinocorallia longicatena TaxID=111803 RepID=A0ABP6Q7P9_9ACTN